MPIQDDFKAFDSMLGRSAPRQFMTLGRREPDHLGLDPVEFELDEQLLALLDRSTKVTF